MKPVLSTYRILKEKAINADIDEHWIDWAIEMMHEGYEVDSLYQLAGMSKPFNQFELQSLTNTVLKDLHLDYSNKQETLKNYAYFLIQTNIENADKYYEILKEFRDIYYELEMDSEFESFAILFWAKEDLIYSEIQWYWEGANRANIDKIIHQQFTIWKTEFECNK